METSISKNRQPDSRIDGIKEVLKHGVKPKPAINPVAEFDRSLKAVEERYAKRGVKLTDNEKRSFNDCGTPEQKLVKAAAIFIAGALV